MRRAKVVVAAGHRPRDLDEQCEGLNVVERGMVADRVAYLLAWHEPVCAEGYGGR